MKNVRQLVDHLLTEGSWLKLVNGAALRDHFIQYLYKQGQISNISARQHQGKLQLSDGTPIRYSGGAWPGLDGKGLAKLGMQYARDYGFKRSEMVGNSAVYKDQHGNELWIKPKSDSIWFGKAKG